MNKNYTTTLQEISSRFFKSNIVTHDEIPMYKSYEEDEELVFETDEFISFENFSKQLLCKNFIIDDMVYAKVMLVPCDFNNDKTFMYKAYEAIMEIIDEIKFNIPDIIKTGLDLFDFDIRIYSDFNYNRLIKDDSNNLGQFDPNKKTISIRLTPDSKQNITTLHHEIGHFIDFVNGFDSVTEYSDYASSDDDRIFEAFSNEVWSLRSYAKKSRQEFFAVAYEYKMTGGDMEDLEFTDNAIFHYFKEFITKVNLIKNLGLQ